MFFVLLFIFLFSSFLPSTESINCVGFRAEAAGSLDAIHSLPKHPLQCDQCVSYFCRRGDGNYALGAGCLGDLLNDCRFPRETVRQITSMQTYTGCYHTNEGIFWFCYGREDCENDKHLLQCF